MVIIIFYFYAYGAYNETYELPQFPFITLLLVCGKTNVSEHDTMLKVCTTGIKCLNHHHHERAH